MRVGVRFRGEIRLIHRGLLMTRPIRMFVGAVAVAVIATAVVGTLAGSDQAEAATQHTLRIPAAAFTPTDPSSEFINFGQFIQNHGSSSAGFVAPVILEGNTAVVHSIRLHYLDNGSDRICVNLMRVNLKNTGERWMSSMCTRNAVPEVRARIDTTIHPDTVGPDNAAYVWVYLPPGPSYGLYGVTIVYTSNV